MESERNVPVTGASSSDDATLPPSQEAVTLPPRSEVARPDSTETVAHPHSGRGSMNLPAPPGFELMRELGRGGMGVVYQARQSELKRSVALKMILAGGHAAPDELSRFRTEAEAVARVQHANIVQVFEVGEHEGLPFLVLEFCGGGSLAARLDGTPWPADQAADMVETLARAMHAAHQQGIIHRDLKPANILLQLVDGDDAGNGHGESRPTSQARAIPKIGDFGLAKNLDDTSARTQSGAILGTPSYMAPEQAAGQGAAIGPATDVYALGAILYELLTGRPPFKASTPLDTVLQVVGEEPAPPRQLNSKTPADLETICLKCLRKDPRQRYSSAAALADDLRRFRNHEPIQARRAGAVERCMKWARRKPALAALILVGLVALVVILGGGVLFTASLQREKLETQRQLARAEWLVYAGKVNLALREFQRDDVARARELLQDSPKELRGWEHAYIQRLCDGFDRELPGHSDFVAAVAFRGDGKQLASGSVDRTIKIWDASTWKNERTLSGHGDRVTGVAFSPDGRRLASVSRDISVRIWDLATGETLRTMKGYQTVAFHPEGKLVAAAEGSLRRILVWDSVTGDLARTLDIGRAGISKIAFSPNGKWIGAAGGSEKAWAEIWDATTGKAICTLVGAFKGLRAFGFSPDSKRAVVAGTDGLVRIHDIPSGKELLLLKGHQDYVYDAVFTQDGNRLVTCGMDNTVRLWDANSGEQLSAYKGNPSHAVAVSPDGRLAASGSGIVGKSGRVLLWTLSVHPEAVTLETPWRVNAVAVSGDGRFAAVGGGVGGDAPGMVQLYDVDTGREVVTLSGHREGKNQALGVNDLAFSPDAAVLASASFDRTIKLWEVATGKELQSLRGHAKAVASVAFNHDGSMLASGSFDHTVRLWDLKGNTLQTLTADETLYSLAFRGDGKVLVAGGGAPRFNVPGHVWIWDVSTGQLLHRLKGHAGPVRGVAISPDGSMLASASWDKTLKIWDAATGKERATLKGHADLVYAVAFTPDGRRIVSGSMDGSVRLWDHRTAQEAMILRMPQQGAVNVAAPPSVERLAISRNGRIVAGAAGNVPTHGVVRAWSAGLP